MGTAVNSVDQGFLSQWFFVEHDKYVIRFLKYHIKDII